MKITTLCYISCEDKTLMLYRNKKESDENAGKWIGIGGKLENNESPDEGIVREVYEESGIRLYDYRFRGIITFVSDIWETQYMCLYTGEVDSFEITDCTEGELHWIEKEKLPQLEMWEGDKIFFDLIQRDHPFFSLKLIYKGDFLEKAVLDGRELEI